jgi:hypothetical protein
VCPISIGHQPGNTDPDRIPDFQCAYNLVSLEYRERFPVQPGPRERLSQGPMSEQLRARFGLAAPRATARRKARGRPEAGI